jgi:hypothetical protein
MLVKHCYSSKIFTYTFANTAENYIHSHSIGRIISIKFCEKFFNGDSNFNTQFSHLPIHLSPPWLYSPCGPWLLFHFLICTVSVGLLGWGISLSQGHYLHAEQCKHRINAHRHPCLEWDSNLRFQRFSERRRFMP